MASPSTDLSELLAWLDHLIREALDCATAVHGAESGSDPFRGLHITPSEMTRLLNQDAGDRLLARRRTIAPLDTVPVPATIRHVVQASALEPFDLAVLWIAAAPDLDLRYERFYAYLQDDVNRRRPTVDLALSLLCRDLNDRLRRRTHFAPNSPLFRHRLVHLAADRPHSDPPLLAQSLRVDDQILAVLLGEQTLDRRIANSCRLLVPSPSSHLDIRDEGPGDGLAAACAHYGAAGEPLVLLFHGSDRRRKRSVCDRIAAERRQPILEVDVPRLRATSPDFDASLFLVFRTAWLQSAILVLEGCDQLHGPDESPARRHLARHLAQGPGVVILLAARPFTTDDEPSLGEIPIAFATPDAGRRFSCWEQALGERGLHAIDRDLVESLAQRYTLDGDQIQATIATAIFEARRHSPIGTPPGADVVARELFDAARQQTRHVLANLATRVPSSRGWDDLVLPADALAQLHEICGHVACRGRVLDRWGFREKLSSGKGTHALFAGPSGTGKTLAAEIVANDLKLDLFRINLAGVVSKYIGETEKNLDRIFLAAEQASAVLLFDEADALFGKRSEVRDAHDRYANIEISYLLQKMEQFDGISILATNLRQNLDDAFLRRLAFVVQFPFPDQMQRRRIWDSVWPSGAALAADVDLDRLSEELQVSGGSIRNIAVAAAYLAAAGDQPIGMRHLEHAAARECQKIGRVPGWRAGIVTAAQLRPVADLRDS